MGVELRQISTDDDSESEKDISQLYDKEKNSVFNLGLIAIQLLKSEPKLHTLNLLNRKDKIKIEFENIKN